MSDQFWRDLAFCALLGILIIQLVLYAEPASTDHPMIGTPVTATEEAGGCDD